MTIDTARAIAVVVFVLIFVVMAARGIAPGLWLAGIPFLVCLFLCAISALIFMTKAIFGATSGVWIVASSILVGYFLFRMVCSLSYDLAPAKKRIELTKAEIKRRHQEKTPDKTPGPGFMTLENMYLRSLRDRDLVSMYNCALRDYQYELCEERELRAIVEEA